MDANELYLLILASTLVICSGVLVWIIRQQ